MHRKRRKVLMQACLQEELFFFSGIRRMPDSEKEPKGGFELRMANDKQQGAERRIRAEHGE